MSFWEKCIDCGRIIGFENYMVSSLMGSYGDLEPPEPDFLCLTCWDSYAHKDKNLLYNVSYLKPLIWRDGVKYRYLPVGDSEVEVK